WRTQTPRLAASGWKLLLAWRTGAARGIPLPGRCRLQLILGRVDHDHVTVVRVLSKLQSAIADGDFTLAHAKEAADADDNRGDLAVLAKHDVFNFTDRLVGGIGDIGADQFAGARLTCLMSVELA